MSKKGDNLIIKPSQVRTLDRKTGAPLVSCMKSNIIFTKCVSEFGCCSITLAFEKAQKSLFGFLDKASKIEGL